ncbi:MAG: ABC transporter substrate-binding protein [Alphaproteobacteria bacterium]|nr:ABC transporter substrate-binding protein [Alphaproteobacteria bacterium]
MKKLLCVLCAVLAIAGCKQEKSDKPVVQIAALYPMSGDGAFLGDTARKVADWFISDFEKNNPNAKYKYRVIFEDVQFSATKAAIAVQKVVAIDKVDAMMSIQSSVAMVLNSVAEKNKIVQLSFAADPRVATGDYNFRISTGLDNIINMTFDKMKAQKMKTFSTVALANDAASVAVIDEFKKSAAQNNDIKLLSSYSINAGDKNFDTILQKIKIKNPDILVFEALTPESDLFLRAMRKTKMNIPVTGIWTIASLKDKSLAEGMWYVDDAGATDKFMSEFKTVIGGDETNYGEYVYTILATLVNAWESADAPAGQKPTPENVVASIMKNTAGLNTALGNLTIQSDGSISLPGVMKQIKNGEQILITE